jgi:hypothetical protein
MNNLRKSVMSFPFFFPPVMLQEEASENSTLYRCDEKCTSHDYLSSWNWKQHEQQESSIQREIRNRELKITKGVTANTQDITLFITI